MKTIILSVLILTNILLLSCTTPRVAFSVSSLNDRALEVDGRKGLFTKERMKFGEYTTTKVKRSWTRGQSARTGWYTGIQNSESFDNIISTEYIRKKQTVRFEMTDGSNMSEVYCVSKFNAKDLQIGNRPNSIVNIAAELLLKTDESESNYYIQLYTNKHPRPWELLLDNQLSQSSPKKYSGVFAMDKENYYTLRPITQMMNKQNKPANILFGSIGFEILNSKNEPVAAVSTLNKGIVYIGDLPSEERFLLANLCAAILMQEQLG